MATKKEIFETVTTSVSALCDEHKVANKFREKLMDILTANLAPKASGASINLDEVTKKDEAGNITEIQCSVSGVFLPATKEFFYEDKAGKGIVGLDGTHLKRLSRQAESIRKQHIKTLAATEKAIMADVLDGAMTPEEGKAELEKVKAIKPDYSSVTAELPQEDSN
jgi:hypothetical protein